MNYKLGILDQSPVVEGTSNYDTLKKTVDLAQKAEEWGYERFWVSEHHNSDSVAGSSPEVLVSYLLAKTKTIRVGSGGIMLQHYSPYKVVENFHVLSTLEPGRVDLGIGKAPGGLPLSTKALQYGTVNTGTDFEERLAFLQQLIFDNIPGTHEFSGIQATPIPPVKPKTYLLGASVNSAKLAAKLGISFAFARFINSDNKVFKEAANTYRENYPNGTFIASVAVITAPTEAEAKELAGHQKIIKVHLASGRTLTLQTVKQAEKFGEESGEAYEVKTYDANIIYGTPIQVKKTLDELHEVYEIDEFILHTPVPNPEQRLRSFELLSPKNLKKQVVYS
ncbi:LLM class flavin-dependent oxidoreductase [Sporosarcina sp. G11-34]|uniref:LLM class flavin-dependent oxidoreductase n=1 Tax=Sporosarcina sp. G11-34 TaxID=2849605 RepID=UPI0022A9113F|nr:LLM class flavin-dependent oxidoreductase [Sporosarcina sp. G11-34]MCZ2260155.1 LLM class flavin-dependent oxidoreductase [Sporosarcina sp. G11-34]